MLEKERTLLIDEAVALSWYSRGAIQYQSALDMAYIERKQYFSFINNRMEKLKDAMHPVY